MPTYTQGDKPLSITTPLGEDVLLLTGFRGHEAISELFNFQLDVVAQLTAASDKVHFDRIIGQSVTVEMRLVDGNSRYFNGIVKRFSQGARDEKLAQFRAELVPKFWLLTKKVRSRIFQNLTVPDILNQVLTGLDVSYEIFDTYYPRDYCVQYRESDFDFASRLMEETGIYYFFKHTDGAHQMIVTDVANQHPDVPEQSEISCEHVSGLLRQDMRVTAWEKSQELRSGEYTLWDHCFELPGNHLEAKHKIVESVAVGSVTHKLKVGGNDQLEIYNYPGGYAQRFDGVDRNGQPRPQDLQKIFRDKDKTVQLRMEREESASLEINGASDCGHFVAGHKFALREHFDADDTYLLTRVEHDARVPSAYRSDEPPTLDYENRFTCIPAALPYRPPRVTPKPVIAGIQTATVAGPAGQEIFCDKYGRVKVQFHWDREGKNDAGSSCWLRVAQVWAGNGWGAFFWPRIGHEVVVNFEEGDPDQPLITGSVYNAANMPPFALPMKNQLAGLKSCSVSGSSQQHFNGIVFDDTKGHEHLGIHSERHMSFNSEFDKVFHGGRHKGERVSSANVMTVGGFPGGGGSGGGFDDGDSTPAARPGPAETLGLNSAWTYGENLGVTVGLNHGSTFGNGLSICINPLGLVAGVPGIPLAPWVTGMIGSGVGGTMSLTIGSNASITLGQSFSINIGPPAIQVNAGPGAGAANYGNHLPTVVCCGILGALVIIWAIVYGTDDDNMARANEATIFQTIIDTVLGVIMLIEASSMMANTSIDDALKALYRQAPNSTDYDKMTRVKGFGLAGLGLGVAASIFGPIAATQAEAKANTSQS